MDKECVKICNALNRLPSVRTTDSCCGHGKHNFCIWFYASDIRVLNALGRLMSHNYAPYCWYKDKTGKYRENWKITLDVCDTMDFKKEVLFCLMGNKNNPNMYKEADDMAGAVIYIWNNFCTYTLKRKPFYKSKREYDSILKEYVDDVE